MGFLPINFLPLLAPPYAPTDWEIDWQVIAAINKGKLSSFSLGDPEY